MEMLQTQYHLEVYENSFENDASFSIQSSTPISSLSIGDYFNHRTIDTWHNSPNTETEVFQIKEIEHIFWTIENSHIGHKIMVCLKIVPRKW